MISDEDYLPSLREISGLCSVIMVEGSRMACKDTRTIFEIGKAIEREKRLANQGETSGSLGNTRKSVGDGQ